MSTPTGTARDIATSLASAIREAGWSQRDVADATGIPLVTLSRRLTGKSPLTITELAAITEAIGVSLAALVLAAEDAA